MKLLFDQNLSHHLVEQLAGEFPGSTHVRNVSLSKSPDIDIWNFAKAGGFMIVSKDADFQQRALLYGYPPKVIWIRLGNCTTAQVRSLLQSRVDDIRAFEIDSTASFLVLA